MVAKNIRGEQMRISFTWKQIWGFIVGLAIIIFSGAVFYIGNNNAHTVVNEELNKKVSKEEFRLDTSQRNNTVRNIELKVNETNDIVKDIFRELKKKQR